MQSHSSLMIKQVMGEEKLFKSEQNVSPLIWQVGEIAFKGAL